MNIKKEKLSERPVATLLWGLSILGVIILAMIFYITIPRCINAIDPSIWYRYASSNKITSMIFLEECPETQAFLTGLQNIEGVVQAEEKGDLTGVCEAIYENIDLVCKMAQNDEAYCAYLRSRGLSVDDFRETMSKIAEMSTVLINISFYLALLVYSIFVVGILKLRKVFYITAGVTYVVFEASVFSSGLTDYLLTFIANIWNKIGGKELIYSDTLIYRDTFMSTLKEAMLTVIIFDTVLQARDSKKQKEREYEIEFFRESLSVQRAYLEEKVSATAKYIGRLSLPAKNIYSICEKQIKYWSKRLKRKHINSYYTSIYTSNLSFAKDFVKTIYKLEKNEEEHENAHYIELIKSAELLFAEAYKREMFIV
ncbi:MAG: hypothetical protein J5717_05835 [Lachnospiraceae bacterium]|nr:hypothetical protein [Lachnospiraceae bacterium]